jgi:glycosyltransferase involved in cell wall biosynthesis
LRILFVAPAYWPSSAFGGPIVVMRELARGLVGRGHRVEVVTTSLLELGAQPARRGRRDTVDGADVHYLATPLRYRWMGITPSVRRELDSLGRPDVVHVFGFRDFVGTLAAAWARRRGVPYVFEGLGMVRPKLRKVALKRALDSTVYRGVLGGAAVLVAASRLEAAEYRDAGADKSRIVVRPNGFPDPTERPPRPGRLRTLLGLGRDEPVVLSVGRIARGKGLDLLLRAARDLPPEAHVAIVGPDDRHGMAEELSGLRDAWKLTGRVHLVGSLAGPLDDVYADADVFVLASAHENFGLVVAEAAAAGTASVVSDRCGIADLVSERAALVVGYDAIELREAVARLLAEPALREKLGAGGRAVAGECAWPRVVEQQEAIYRRVVAR